MTHIWGALDAPSSPLRPRLSRAVNYRHAFHAGNHADVLKHARAAPLPRSLKRKDTPFAVLDTHAGRGLYDLSSAEAQRSPEWRDGIGRLWDWPEPPAPVARYLGGAQLQR